MNSPTFCAFGRFSCLQHVDFSANYLKLPNSISNLIVILLTFVNSTVDYRNWCCFISIKFDVKKKWIIWRNFVADMLKFLDVLIFLVFSKPGIQYLWQVEMSICKVLVPNKVVPLKNDYFFHQKLELHR